MQLGICLTPIYPKAIKDCSLMLQLIEKIRGEGVFQCVEIYFEGTKEEEQEIKKSLLGAGLTAVYLGGLPIKRDGIDISAEREEKRKGSVLACKRHIDHAINMGCKKMVVASGPIWKENKNSERVIEQTRRSLEELDFYCRGSNLQISLEPFPVKTSPYMAVGGKEISYQVKYVREFLLSEGKLYTELVPNADMITPNKSGEPYGYRGWAFASATRKRDLILGYAEKDCPRIAVRALRPYEKYEFAWFDPTKGMWLKSHELTVNSVGMISLPEYPEDHDWAFKLKKKNLPYQIDTSEHPKATLEEYWKQKGKMGNEI